MDKARGHADVSNVTGLHDVVECLHGLLNRCIVVEAMALENVDVVKLEALQAVLD
jgi:hypothetical protein